MTTALQQKLDDSLEKLEQAAVREDELRKQMLSRMDTADASLNKTNEALAVLEKQCSGHTKQIGTIKHELHGFSQRAIECEASCASVAEKVSREKDATELFRVDCHERISAAETLVAQCTADSEATRLQVLDMQANVDDKIGYECMDELRDVDKQLRLRIDQLESTLGSVCTQYDGVLETKAQELNRELLTAQAGLFGRLRDLKKEMMRAQ